MTTDDLPEYLVWANGRAAAMLRAAPGEAREAGVPILAHLLAVEQIWAGRLTGAPAPAAPMRPDWTLEHCEALIPGNAALYRDILADPAAPTEVRYRSFQGEAFVSARADILGQVLLHGTYHRGQISQEVRRSGGESLDTDYILFRRERGG